MSTSKLYGICLVKNEDDIIAQTLTYALRHCTKIFVIDNGSTDGTWKIVQSLSEEHSQIIPLLQTYEPYTEGLLALAYNKYHSEFSDQDWWLVLDADEFLAEDPQPVIQCAMGDKADMIHTWQIQFFYTDVDRRGWMEERDSRDIPIFARRRYYSINWQEVRLFRNYPGRPWNVKISGKVPDSHTKVCRRRILNRHYQYRDPEQIKKRLLLRFGHPSFTHVKSLDWESVIVPSRRLNYYREGEPWHFSASGLIFYYRFVLRSLFRGAVRRLGYIAPRRP
jgi:glycosyltransferase involved in cell wall biosynthesis